VSAAHALSAEVRLYDRLFKSENVAQEEGDFKDYINPDALTVVPTAYVEAALGDAMAGTTYQFLRKGYFCVDTDSKPGQLVFNRTVTLKDTWAKEGAKN
jgi:glutaminyl-tRNA synthetase